MYVSPKRPSAAASSAPAPDRLRVRPAAPLNARPRWVMGGTLTGLSRHRHHERRHRSGSIGRKCDVDRAVVKSLPVSPSPPGNVGLRRRGDAVNERHAPWFAAAVAPRRVAAPALPPQWSQPRVDSPRFDPAVDRCCMAEFGSSLPQCVRRSGRGSRPAQREGECRTPR